MQQASEIFNDGERARIAHSIAAAERRTSAELVVAIASRSGRYDRAEDLFGMTVALAVSIVLWLILEDMRPHGQWGHSATTFTGVALIVGVFLVVFMVATWLASRSFILARLFARNDEMLAEVKRSAIEVCHEHHVQRTAGANGVLVYISLAERLVWVVGDDGVNRVIEHATWDAARDEVVRGFQGGRPTDGIVTAIEWCANALAPHFPRQVNDTDELSNDLLLIDWTGGPVFQSSIRMESTSDRAASSR